MRNNVASFWIDDRVSDLKAMWASGRTGGEIASSFGVTRCAVLGKIFRLGLADRMFVNKRTPEQIQAAKRAKNKRANERRRTHRVNTKKLAPQKLTITNLEALRCVEVEPLGKTLLELGPNECRFPYGDGPYTFCGNPTMGECSYCGPHFGLSARRGRHE